MQRPEVRVISSQTIETNVTEIDSYEAANLLAKYGYSNQPQIPQPKPIDTQVDNNLTFEEIVKKEQQEREAEQRRHMERQQQIRNTPKPYTFDSNNVSYSNNGVVSEDGINFRVTVVSDIGINRDLY